MGYFPNGTAGDDYENRYCCSCIHYPSCAVMEAHKDYNYRDCNDDTSILHMLIPREGVVNQRCRMFFGLWVRNWGWRPEFTVETE